MSYDKKRQEYKSMKRTVLAENIKINITFTIILDRNLQPFAAIKNTRMVTIDKKTLDLYRSFDTNKYEYAISTCSNFVHLVCFYLLRM